MTSVPSRLRSSPSADRWGKFSGGVHSPIRSLVEPRRRNVDLHGSYNHFSLGVDSLLSGVRMPNVLGAHWLVAIGRIGKTVRIRRGPAAVSGDETSIVMLPVLWLYRNHCVRNSRLRQSRWDEFHEDMGRCDVRTIRESEDLPRQ